MTHVRHAAVAGMFYPGSPRELDASVRRYLADAEAPAAGDAVPKAIIAPHAGYVYSGPIAATAYARLRPVAGRIRRVVLLGPCHRVAVRGLAAPSAEAFATPLGRVPIDAGALGAVVDLPQVQVFDETHADEHSLEVHLPFLQTVLGDFRLVPLVVGQASAAEVAEVLDRLWGGPETLIVVSSDLSHYLDYDAARRLDAETCRAIEALDPSAIGREQACGRVPVAGLLALARRRGLRVATLDLRNSGDTAGDHRRVVGYGAWAFVEPEAAARRPGDEGASEGTDFVRQTETLLSTHGETLLHLAASSIEHGLAYGRPLPVSAAEHAPELAGTGASFVTLKANGRLRGCVGSPEAYRPLVEDVADNAYAAAFRDRRFAKLAGDERPAVALSVSVLSPASPMAFTDEADLLGQLAPGVDGLIIRDGSARALFLPQVWEQLAEPADFLGNLKVKAGLDRGHWSPSFEAARFVAVSASSDQLSDPRSLWT